MTVLGTDINALPYVQVGMVLRRPGRPESERWTVLTILGPAGDAMARLRSQYGEDVWVPCRDIRLRNRLAEPFDPDNAPEPSHDWE